MANELKALAASGKTLYAIVRRHTDDKVYSADLGQLVTYDDDDWTTYAITMTEVGASGLYLGVAPALTANTYYIDMRYQAGVDPALDDARVGGRHYIWTGSEEAVSPLEELVDGLALRDMLKVLFAAICGETESPAVNRIEFKDQEDNVVLSITYGNNRGVRTSSDISI